MFVVDVAERGGESRRFVVHKPELTIGRVQGNDIVLPKGNVSKRHARCVYKDGKFIIVDLKSTNGTWVNGRRISSPLVIRETDKVYIGDFVLAIGEFDEVFEEETTQPVAATELRLLSSIAQREEGSRMVYADWLEEQGDPVRAEFLRVQESLVAAGTTPGNFVHAERLRQLAPTIDVSWRYKVARPFIENCLAVEFECPREWGSLATTEHARVRHCETCKQNVFYCTTVEEAAHHAQRGHCVAVDIAPRRSPRDLEPRRPPMVGRMVALPDY